ncbi:hypothetical protein H4R33_004239 [Dimargaris cristalligena]|nr:hypothetical protein H4R33_004239 [Dimargaris cristalligena]
MYVNFPATLLVLALATQTFALPLPQGGKISGKAADAEANKVKNEINAAVADKILSKKPTASPKAAPVDKKAIAPPSKASANGKSNSSSLQKPTVSSTSKSTVPKKNAPAAAKPRWVNTMRA